MAIETIANGFVPDLWMEFMDKELVLLASSAVLLAVGCASNLNSTQYAILKTVQHADGNRPAMPGEVRGDAIEREDVLEGVTDALIRRAEQKAVEAISK